MHLQAGEVLNNRYRIVKLLGQGGFGAVYRAWDMNMECPRAVKENLDTSPEAQKQFKLEAKILGRLTHQNLPNVIDHFIIPGQGQYLVMDFIDGEDLQEMLDKQSGPLPESQVLPWIEQVCDALSYLHSQNPPIIHRDIKPANIKITPNGKAMLVDFGIAKVFDPLLSTTVGARAVTPGYSPHEQYGQGKTDPRTDIYALGATLYTLLTNQIPVESIQRVISDPLLPPDQVNPSISSGVASAIRQAIDPNPILRPQNIETFKNTIKVPSPVVSTLSISKPLDPQTFPFPGGATQTKHVQYPTFSVQRLMKWLPWAAGFILLFVVVNSLWPDSSPNPSERTKTAATGTPSQTVQTASDQALDTPTASKIPTTGTPRPTFTFSATPQSTSTLTPTNLPSSQTATSGLAFPPDCKQIGQIWTSPRDGMILSCIPAGEFLMGSTDNDLDASDDEFPQHTVYLSAYWMDQTEVNNVQYAACVTAGRCDMPSMVSSSTRDTYYGNEAYGNFPVIYVSWEDANAYCLWVGRRLPTEVEWEKAARGDDGRTFPWGETIDCQKANFKSCIGDTTAVGRYPEGASPYGVMDMAGNVWEWVLDWFEVYPGGDQNANIDFGKNFRVLRGGSWETDNRFIRISNRTGNFPDLSRVDDGFRCARSP